MSTDYQKLLDDVAEAGLLDDTIREQLHDELAPCDPVDWAWAYDVAHEAKYGECFPWPYRELVDAIEARR